MRASTWVAIAAVVGALLFVGCDGIVIYGIDGDWAVGTVRFTYGDSRTWTFSDVLIEVDTSESLIYFSGYDSESRLWAYRGEYERDGNRVVVEDMPERDLGFEDTMDLRLEFSRNRVDGTATNWVYDDGDLDAVGAAAFSGQRVTSSAARNMDSAAAEGKSPKAWP